MIKWSNTQTNFSYWWEKSKPDLCTWKPNECRNIESELLLSDLQADEPAPVGNYDQRKQEEGRRLQNVLEQLNTLYLELSPPGPSSAAGSVQWTKKRRITITLAALMRLWIPRDHSKGDSKKKDVDEDSEDDDDDDDDDEKDDDKDSDFDQVTSDKKLPSQSDRRFYTVLSEFKGEQDGDLSVQVSLTTGWPCEFSLFCELI